MRSFQESLAEFDKRGLRVVAISADPPEVTREHVRRLGLSFTFLCDPQAEVIRRYELLHAGAGPDGADIARPAEFLIDAAGTVRWVNLSESYAVRARPEALLQAADRFGL